MQKYIEISTPRGIMRGYIHLPEQMPCPVCIMLHGFTGDAAGDKFSYVKISRKLESAGIASIRMNFLGSSESDLEFKDMTFGDELECSKQIIESVNQDTRFTSIYVLGHSMGGALASELSKIYPDQIQKICLWAPALNIPELFSPMPLNQEIYDVWGFEVGVDFIKDIVVRDLFSHLDTYQNDLMIIHGNDDQIVDYHISERYLKGYSHPKFITIEGGSHSFSKIEDMAKVIDLTYQFFKGE